jgi:hypothetical protein
VDDQAHDVHAKRLDAGEVLRGRMRGDRLSGPARATDVPGSRGWRRALLVLIAALLVVASVAAQALDLTPLAIVLLVLAVVSLAPLALPAVEP